MRLTNEQRQLITTRIRQYFGQDAHVWLFGSRLDDNKRGGDVDLYVEAEQPKLLSELKCKIGLEEALDLHVDLVVRQPEQDDPIYRLARNEGVQL